MYDPYEEQKDENYSKKDTSVSLKDGIERLLKAYRIKDSYDASLLKSDWEKLVGRTIASHTTNLYLNKNTLIISVNSDPLRHQLNSAKERLMHHINTTFKKNIVQKIIIR